MGNEKEPKEEKDPPKKKTSTFSSNISTNDDTKKIEPKDSSNTWTSISDSVPSQTYQASTPKIDKPKPITPKKPKPSNTGITISSNTGGSNTPATISTGNVYKDPVTGSTIQTGQTVKDVQEGKYNPSVIDSTTGNFLGESSTPTQVEEKNTTLGKAKGTGQIPESPQSMTTVSVSSPSGVMAVQNLGGKVKDEKGASGHPKYGKIKTVANPYGEGSPIGAGEGTIAAGDYDTNPAVKKQTDTMLKTMAGDSTPSQDLLTGDPVESPIISSKPTKLNPSVRRGLLALGMGGGDALRRIRALMKAR